MTLADREELLELVEALCCGTIAPVQHERLQARLAADADARQLYFDYLDLHLQLRQWRRAAAAKEDEGSVIGGQGSGFCELEHQPLVASPSPPPRLPSPFSPLSSFAGAILSYGVVGIIVCVGVLATWAWKAPADQPGLPLANAARSVAPAEDLRVPSVGRITRISGFKFSDAKTAREAATVPLGGEYFIGSGVLEISYNSGATVVLEGCARYLVDSPNSGLLLMGKATVKSEVPDAAARSAEAARRASPPHLRPRTAHQRSSFVLRTPTAIMVDCGAEFGVWVDEAKTTGLQIHRGNVDFQLPGKREELPMKAGDSLCVVLRRNGVREVFFNDEHHKPSSVLADRMPNSLPIYSGGTKDKPRPSVRPAPEKTDQNDFPDS
jgi:hypothetical protein